MTAVQYLRLFIVCAFAVTTVICAVRGSITHDVRARIGNVAFGYLAAVIWLAQVPYWNAPLTWLTWVTAVGGALCLVYVATVIRKGP